MVTNNVTRLLAARKIPFQAFELPQEKVGAMDAARILSIDPQLMYKTIVVTRERPGKPVLAVIPAGYEVDLKALAAFLGEKKMKLPTQREAEQLTGLQAGGISPLALVNRGFLVILDQSARQHEQFHISGGQRGLNIRLPVKAFVDLVTARIAVISVPSSTDLDEVA